LISEDKETAVKLATVYSTKKLSELQKEKVSPVIGIEDSDFIKIRFNRIPPKLIKNQLENVIITSQNGVEALLNSFTKEQLNFKNIFCVGRRTKKLIEKRIGSVVHAAKNAAKLAEYLATELKNKEATYFCSDLRLDVLPSYLKEKGILLNEVEVYKTMLSPVKIHEDISGVLFFSPSGIESYLEVNDTNKIAFCIGETTAVQARKYFETVHVANLPSVENLLESLNTYFSK